MPTLRDVAEMLDAVIHSETQFHDSIGQIVTTVAEAIIFKELGDIATAETTLTRADDARNIHMNKYATNLKLDADLRASGPPDQGRVAWKHAGLWVAAPKPESAYFILKASVYTPSSASCTFEGFEVLTSDIAFMRAQYPWGEWSKETRASFAAEFTRASHLFLAAFGKKLKDTCFDVWYSLNTFKDQYGSFYKFLRALCHAVTAASREAQYQAVSDLLGFRPLLSDPQKYIQNSEAYREAAYRLGNFELRGDAFAVWMLRKSLPDLFTHTDNSLTLAEAHQILQRSVHAKATVSAHAALTLPTDGASVTSATSGKSKKNPKGTLLQNGKLVCSYCKKVTSDPVKHCFQTCHKRERDQQQQGPGAPGAPGHQAAQRGNGYQGQPGTFQQRTQAKPPNFNNNFGRGAPAHQAHFATPTDTDTYVPQALPQGYFPPASM
jgi:hypothetical protein